MVETPTLITIQTPRTRPIPLLGGGFELVVSSIPLLNTQPERNNATVPTICMMFADPHESGAGARWWLITVGDTRKDAPEMTAERAEREVRETELNGAPKAVGMGRAQLWWRGTGRCRLLRCVWGDRVMKQVWDEEGDPDTKGLWLAQRLLPRVGEGAIRDFEDGRFHLWLKL